MHVEYLRKMVREDRIPAHRFPGGREIRFLRDELIAWVRTSPATTARRRRKSAPKPDALGGNPADLRSPSVSARTANVRRGRARRQGRVITGGNSGIGSRRRSRSRRRRARRDHSRDAEAGATALAEIEARSGGSVEVMALDLASFASVRAFADEFASTRTTGSTSSSNNAGVILKQRRDDRGRSRDAVPDEPPRALPADEPAPRPARRECAGAGRRRRVRRAPLRTRRARLRRPRVDAQLPRRSRPTAARS